jgi:hypothetical protein
LLVEFAHASNRGSGLQIFNFAHEVGADY